MPVVESRSRTIYGNVNYENNRNNASNGTYQNVQPVIIFPNRDTQSLNLIFLVCWVALQHTFVILFPHDYRACIVAKNSRIRCVVFRHIIKIPPFWTCIGTCSVAYQNYFCLRAFLNAGHVFRIGEHIWQAGTTTYFRDTFDPRGVVDAFCARRTCILVSVRLVVEIPAIALRDALSTRVVALPTYLSEYLAFHDWTSGHAHVVEFRFSSGDRTFVHAFSFLRHYRFVIVAYWKTHVINLPVSRGPVRYRTLECVCTAVNACEHSIVNSGVVTGAFLVAALFSFANLIRVSGTTRIYALSNSFAAVFCNKVLLVRARSGYANFHRSLIIDSVVSFAFLYAR